MGLVNFNHKSMTLDIYDNEMDKVIYQIDLERCKNSSQLLDWILQIKQKRWFQPRIIIDIFDELDKLSFLIFSKDTQTLYCPFGDLINVDWKQRTCIKIKEKTDGS